MTTKYPHLCSPITIGNVTFRNRMFAAPVGGTDITADCSVGPRTPAFYEMKAKGGAASVTASELVVHPQTDASHMFHLNLTTPGNLASWTWVADAIMRHGAVPSIELSHSGQYAGTYLVDKDKKKGLSQFGPSDWVRPDGIPVKALTKEQIADIVKAYGDAATLAKRVGFQMVMVHCGHGWLINQFLSPAFNHRTDEYGGSFENRIRFAREVLQSVRNAVGPGFPIEMRMSGSELFEGGYTLEDGVEIAKALEDLVNLIHVSAGSYQFGFFTTHPSMFSDHGCNVYLAAEIKKHVKVPVATIGALNDPAQMEEIIASGKADVVEMTRALLADAELPNKVIAGKEDEIVLVSRGAEVIRVPFDYDFTALDYDGVYVSNGPGCPCACEKTVEHLKKALAGNKPVFGLGLGYLLVAQAAGCETTKLKRPHRSANQPVRKEGSNRSYITAQNVSCTVKANTIPADWEVYFTNLNDGSVDGIRHKSKPFAGTQFNPEVCVGLTENVTFIDEFISKL